MHRCPPPVPLRPATLALCCAVLLATPCAVVQAQPLASAAAGQRTFPATAERGTLKVLSRTQAELDGKPVRLAPGLRIFNEKNALVFAHTLAGRPLTVNYVTEASTGRLHTAWLLTPAEAKQQQQQQRKGGVPAFQSQPAQ